MPKIMRPCSGQTVDGVQWRRIALIGTWIQMDEVQQVVLSKMGHQGHSGEMMGLKTESSAVVGTRS
jgi:hypothetical protein